MTFKPLTYARTNRAEEVLPIENPRGVSTAVLIAAALYKRHVEHPLWDADRSLALQVEAPLRDALQYCKAMQQAWWTLIEDETEADAERVNFKMMLTGEERAVFDTLFGEVR